MRTDKLTSKFQMALQESQSLVLGKKTINSSNLCIWGVESHRYILDWNWNEDRCTISTGHGPENITCLRRFATGLIKSINKKESVSSIIEKLARNVHRVFDYLRMTKNSRKIIF